MTTPRPFKRAIVGSASADTAASVPTCKLHARTQPSAASIVEEIARNAAALKDVDANALDEPALDALRQARVNINDVLLFRSGRSSAQTSRQKALAEESLLPLDVLALVMSFLAPQDMARACQVSRHFDDAVAHGVCLRIEHLFREAPVSYIFDRPWRRSAFERKGRKAKAGEVVVKRWVDATAQKLETLEDDAAQLRLLLDKLYVQNNNTPSIDRVSRRDMRDLDHDVAALYLDELWERVEEFGRTFSGEDEVRAQCLMTLLQLSRCAHRPEMLLPHAALFAERVRHCSDGASLCFFCELPSAAFAEHAEVALQGPVLDNDDSLWCERFMEALLKLPQPDLMRLAPLLETRLAALANSKQKKVRALAAKLLRSMR